MSSGQKRALQSDGVGETFSPPADLIRIVEEDPDHPHHAEHMARVSIDDPDMQALIASMREFSWRKSITMSVYLDGDTYAVSAGRRRLTAVRIVNAERAAAKDKRGPIRPRVVVDDNPALTTTMENSMRKDDPPMVKARRFVDNSATMGAQAAARAAGFLTIAEANACAKILSVPDASFHAAVNAGSITVDTAARAAKAGSAKVREVIAKATGSDGNVDPAKAKAAARAAVPVKVRTRPHPKVLANVEAALGLQHRTDADDAFRNGVLWALGADVSGKVSPAVLAVLTDNGWGEGKAAK